MSNRTKNVALITLLVGAVLAVAFAPTALAALTSQPQVANSSTIQDGSTINIYDAAETNSTELIVDTDNADTIESAEVTISTVNRNLTVYEADDTAGEYNFTADVDTSGDV